MPTWVVATINGVLMAYCVFMLIFGHIKKKKAIKDAKARLEKEMQEDESKVKLEQSKQENKEN